MYNDYPIVHETVITNYTNIILITIAIILSLGLFILTLGKIFKKAGKNPFLSLIPIYNIYLLMIIADLPRINIILFFIPVINIFVFIRLAIELSKRFGKKSSYGSLLFFFPYIFYPVLAFNKDKYVGINNENVKEIYLDDKIIEQVRIEEAKVIKKDTNINMGSSIKENPTIDSSGVLHADINVLDQSRKVTDVEYIECPTCHNKVKKGIAVCFFCGTNLKNLENNQKNV